jgi:hypothetical protein
MAIILYLAPLRLLVAGGAEQLTLLEEMAVLAVVVVGVVAQRGVLVIPQVHLPLKVITVGLEMLTVGKAVAVAVLVVVEQMHRSRGAPVEPEQMEEPHKLRRSLGLLFIILAAVVEAVEDLAEERQQQHKKAAAAMLQIRLEFQEPPTLVEVVALVP